MKRLYADCNATAPLRIAAKNAMIEAMDLTGNASSIHSEGRKARGLIDKARRILADGFGVKPSDVFFTSGATEAANHALMPALSFNKTLPTRILYSLAEHPAIIEGHRFASSVILPLLSTGVVDLQVLEEALKTGEPTLIAIQAANSETGVIQPITEIGDLARKYGAIYLCDAVQAVGKMPLVSLIGADALIISAHKFGGPKGAGALILTSPRVEIQGALIKGGGQEARRRSGTENIASIAGMGAAFEGVMRDFHAEFAHMKDLSDHFESLAEQQVIARSSNRLVNTTSLLIENQPIEALLIKLDLKGIAVSSGSACSSGKVSISPTLQAMGIKGQALRVSWGIQNTREEVERLAEALKFTA